MPTVSIVMLSYNQAEFVRDAVESVLAQTLTDWELVIVENGSTDGSKALLAEYAAREPRIKLISHPDNQSLNKRLNEGVRASTGRFISLLMSDDLYLPGKLEQQTRAFAELDDSFGVVYSPGWHLNVLTQQRWLSNDLQSSGMVLELLLGSLPQGFICPLAPMYRRQCLETYPFHEDLFQEGESILLRIAMRWKFRYQPEPTVVMRDHARNLGKATRRNNECFEVVLDHLRAHPDFPVASRPLVDAVRVRCERAASWQVLRVDGDVEWARRVLIKAVRADWRQLAHPKTMLHVGLAILPDGLRRQANRTLNAIRRSPAHATYVEDYQ
jgi:glycosyltransferase involved in cell wall biosynthesis